jgi:division protein CdvB (Snf7/Vps24/ESCRT-III family)
LNKITSDLRGSLKDRARKIQTTLQSLPLDAPVSEEVEERLLAESSAAADELKGTLDELQKVISILVKFETQNELLDIVRAILKTQTELHRRTQEQRKKDAFEGLID